MYRRLAEQLHMNACRATDSGIVQVAHQNACQRLAHDAKCAPEHQVASVLVLHPLVQVVRDVHEWHLMQGHHSALQTLCFRVECSSHCHDGLRETLGNDASRKVHLRPCPCSMCARMMRECKATGWSTCDMMPMKDQARSMCSGRPTSSS
jgi:hypothetical protein